MDEEFWNFKFAIEVSARYHDWRRGTTQTAIRLARSATIVGALLTLFTASNPLSWAPSAVTTSITGLAILIALVNIWELASNLGEQAVLHTELYRRFMTLQERMAKERDTWNERLPSWEAEAAAIRRDEPPTMWAIYAMCWNQTIDRYQVEHKGYYRPVQWWQSLVRNFVQFRPQDFPAVI